MTVRTSPAALLLAATMISPAVARAQTAPAPACTLRQPSRVLPDDLRETSGLAASRRTAGLFWTHNDAGNAPILYAVDSAGQVTARVAVSGASAVDWEDVTSSACDRGSCLYIADVGDNSGRRVGITVYEIPEPPAGAREAAPRATIHARYPDRAQDAEALFAHGGRLYVVTKGRHGAISLFRLPEAAGDTATLEAVRELWPQPRDAQDRVTAATTSPDGRWIGIRTYRTLFLYPSADLVSGKAVTPRQVSLSPLGEAQGEGIAIAADGTIWTTSEAAGRKGKPRLARLDCGLGREEG